MYALVLPRVPTGVMTELSERTKANMDVVLEETCRQLPHGGDHDSRRFIAERLIEAARSGHSTLGELGIKTLHTPLTPMKVWQAIKDAKAAAARVEAC